MTAAITAVILLVGMVAQVAPVAAAAAEGGGVAAVDPAALFGALRDTLNVGVIGAVIYAIRWGVVNLGPRMINIADRHNRLVEKLEQAVERLEVNHSTMAKQLTELHQSCANWKPNK